MDFFYGRVSGNSARAAFGLYEAGVAFTPHLIDTQKGENRGAPYLALNPMGKIPALTDGADVRLWESNAINWYAAEKRPEAGLLPASPQGRAAVQRWLFFQAAHVSPACQPLMRATNTRMQAFWGFKGDAATEQAGRQELARFLPVLEHGLGDRDWLEGDFSLADIAYAPHLWLIFEGGGFDFSGTPAVRRWLDRLWARPAWRQTMEVIFGG